MIYNIEKILKKNRFQEGLYEYSIMKVTTADDRETVVDRVTYWWKYVLATNSFSTLLINSCNMIYYLLYTEIWNTFS